MWRGAGFRVDIICISRGHDPEASRTLAIPSLPSRLPYPWGSRYLFRVGFPLTLYLDTTYAFNGGSASLTKTLRAFTHRRDTPFTHDRYGTNHVRDNLTPETECVAVAVLMRASNSIGAISSNGKKGRAGYYFF